MFSGDSKHEITRAPQRVHETPVGPRGPPVSSAVLGRPGPGPLQPAPRGCNRAPCFLPLPLGFLCSCRCPGARGNPRRPTQGPSKVGVGVPTGNAFAPRELGAEGNTRPFLRPVDGLPGAAGHAGAFGRGQSPKPFWPPPPAPLSHSCALESHSSVLAQKPVCHAPLGEPGQGRHHGVRDRDGKQTRRVAAAAVWGREGLRVTFFFFSPFSAASKMKLYLDNEETCIKKKSSSF